jgi:hypothetical protein
MIRRRPYELDAAIIKPFNVTLYNIYMTIILRFKVSLNPEIEHKYSSKNTDNKVVYEVALY